VTALTHHFRSLLIALAVLALSAGAALAGRSALSTPARPEQAAPAAAETGYVDESEPSEVPEIEPSEVPENEPIGGSAGDTATGAHPDNHGKLVSEAAQGATPTTFANHGQYVRTIAQANSGQATAATAKTKGQKH
jgi:hypothetical protein